MWTTLASRSSLLLYFFSLGLLFRPFSCIRAQNSPANVPAATVQQKQLAEAQQAMKRGDYTTAEKTLLAGLDQAQKAGNESQALDIVSNLGVLYEKMGKFDQALDYDTRALILAEKRQDMSLIARSLGNLGNVHYFLGHQDKALDYHSRALALQQKLSDSTGIANCLSNIGNVYLSQSRFEQARDFYERSLTLREKLNDPGAVAISCNNLGIVHIRLGNFDTGTDFFKRALALWEKSGSLPDIARILSNLTTLYSLHGELFKASDYGKRALDILEKLKNPQDLALELGNVGSILIRLGRHDEAVALYQRELALQQPIGNPDHIAVSLEHLAVAHYQMGQYEQSADEAERALALCEKQGNAHETAQIQDNLSSVYLRLGRLDRSEDYGIRALNTRRKMGNPRDIAVTLVNLSQACYAFGEYDRALDYAQQALPALTKLGDPQLLTQNYGALGNAFAGKAAWAKASDCYLRALKYVEPTGNAQSIANALNALAAVYWQQGQYQLAEETCQRALERLQTLGNPQDTGQAFNDLGTIYANQRKFDRALSCLLSARKLFAQTGNPLDTVRCLSNLGEVYRQQSRFSQAEACFAQAVRAYERMLSQSGDAEQKSAFQRANERRLYARCADLLAQRRSPSAALLMAERGRGQAMAMQARQNRADLAHLISPADATRLKILGAEQSAAQNIWRASLSVNIPANAEEQKRLAGQQAAAQRRVEEAERERALFETTLFARYPQYRRLQGANPPTLDDLRALARRHPDTLFLEWAIVSDTTTRLFALSDRGGIQTFALPLGEAELSRRATAWLHAIRNRSQEEPRLAYMLYAMLFHSLEQTSLLGKTTRSAHSRRSTTRPFSRLALVADGPLLALPFAALRDGSGQRLIERFALASSVSFGALTWPRDPMRASGSLLCAADSTGGSGPNSGSRQRGGFTPLPAARTEGARLVRLFPGARGLVGPEASEAVIKRIIGQYSLLHFATHGLLDTQRGLRSCLVLAAEPEGSSEDGLLQAREIAGMRLSAQLAVLSACETARGQQSGGEGLMGLSWAFRAAGCPAVVASLWQVDDEATARLMLAFYKALKAGQGKDDALRAAMLAIRREKKHKAPFYWAAFQVIGDTAELKLPAAPARSAAQKPRGPAASARARPVDKRAQKPLN